MGGEEFTPFEAVAVSENAAIQKGQTHAFDNEDSNSMEWSIEFVAESDAAQISLLHDEKGPEYHYVRLEAFEVAAIQ